MTLQTHENYQEEKQLKQTTNDDRGINSPGFIIGVPVCKKCGGAVKDILARVLRCHECGAKALSGSVRAIGDILSERNKFLYDKIIEIIGSESKFLDMITTITDHGVLLRKVGVKSGGLPGAFWRVKPGVGETELSKHGSNILLYYQSGELIPREEIHDAVVNFYYDGSRVIKKSMGKFSMRRSEEKKLENKIKSLLFFFIKRYGHIYKDVMGALSNDDYADQYIELFNAGVAQSVAEKIVNGDECSISEMSNILLFMNMKKLPSNVGRLFDKRKPGFKITYDLPLELIYGDLLYEKSHEG